MTFDTATIVRGLIDARRPFDVLFKLPPEFQIQISEDVFREALEVLLGESSLHHAIEELAQITPSEVYRRVSRGAIYPVEGQVDIQVCSEAADNKFLAAAIALGCDILVTDVADLIELEGNADWVEFRTAHSIPLRIMTPEQLSVLVRGEGSQAGAEGEQGG